MKTRIIAAFIAAGIIAASPGVAQAYIPKRASARADVVSLVKNQAVAQSVFGYEGDDIRAPRVPDARGGIWKGQRLQRVKGGWNVTVIFAGHTRDGAAATTFGTVEVRSIRHGYSATFVPAS